MKQSRRFGSFFYNEKLEDVNFFQIQEETNTQGAAN